MPRFVSQIIISLSLLTIPFPDLESILNVRTETIRKLLNVPYSRVVSLHPANRSLCRHNVNQRLCDPKTKTYIIYVLNKAQLWPMREPRDINCSVSEPEKLIGLDLWLKIIPISEEHDDCTFTSFDVTKIAHYFADPVLYPYLKHIEDQREQLNS
jgi:hypothetical protein